MHFDHALNGIGDSWSKFIREKMKMLSNNQPKIRHHSEQRFGHVQIQQRIISKGNDKIIGKKFIH